ncbi:YslB family protein [Alkalihalobacillus sp. MEB130]|uniref:YslB family protein n=1 Tax=Alkalihalobacillus sp. MEB130 TaxID=2976704 RepID=UPI0028DFDA63|nr:YslB family protein [Alkalihalobacillus sp. MEB130]MDT8859465.1 YslB family protein [Alkalihalobacillus sp. MEB130]
MEDRATQFGYDLIRNDVLKDVLGKEHDSILYWIGKSLARKYPLSNEEETIHFFEKANWGILTKVKEKKQLHIFELQAPWIDSKDERCYQLEAGFLAQQLESWYECITGATYTMKKELIVITVETDKRDPIKQ